MVASRLALCVSGCRQRECTALVRSVHTRRLVAAGVADSNRALVGPAISTATTQTIRPFSGAFIVVMMLSIFTEPWQGPSDWTSRVETPSLTMWMSHLIITGLYPFFPWVLFACFGLTVARLSDRTSSDVLSKRGCCRPGGLNNRSRSESTSRASLGASNRQRSAHILPGQRSIPHRSHDRCGHAVVDRGASWDSDCRLVARGSSLAHRVRVALRTVRLVSSSRNRPWVVSTLDRRGRRGLHRRMDRPGNLACSAPSSND